MFSTAQQSYIDSFLPTYAKGGYKYYVCYTDNLSGGSYYSSTTPDLFIVVSKEKINSTDGYTFDLEGDALKLCIRSGNYSSSSSAVNSERVVIEELTSGSLSVPVYEHIYTNCAFSGHTIQPDYYLSSGGETNVQIQSISFILLFCIFTLFIRSLFNKR